MANPVDKQKIRQRYKGISLDEIEKIPAIEEKDMNTYLDARKVTDETTKTQNRRNRMYNKSLSNA